MPVKNKDFNRTKYNHLMKTLIAYYSFTQNNEKLAMHIQKQLNCDIAKVETANTRNSFSILLDLMLNRKPKVKPIPCSLKSYDYIIFVAPIWAGKIATPMKSFFDKEKLNIKRYSFITLCGGSSGQKQKIERELVSILEKSPVKVLELWVNDLLPAEKKDTIKHTSGFRIEANGFEKFESRLSDFIKDEI